jgi:hypothetical protein
MERSLEVKECVVRPARRLKRAEEQSLSSDDLRLKTSTGGHDIEKENGVSRGVCPPRLTRRDYMERVWFRRKVLVCIATAGNHGLAGIAMPTTLRVC